MATITINNAPVRQVEAFISVHKPDGTQIYAITEKEYIKSIEIQRAGEPNKFFGFGVSHRLNLKLINPGGGHFKTVAANYYLLVKIGNQTFPYFYVTEVHRDENTNEVSITAYDGIYFLKDYKVTDLGLTIPYTLRGFIDAVVAMLKNKWRVEEFELNINDSIREALLETIYPEGANFNSDYDLRSALTAAAEMAGCIYYIEEQQSGSYGYQTFIFEPLGSDEVTINRENYYTLKVGENRRLSAVCSATELGDNVIYNSGVTGTTQYLRDNPFMDIRDDVATIVENIYNTITDKSIAQYDLTWRYLLDGLSIGTKLNLVKKDGTTATTFLINDTISYDGSLRAKTEWNYENALDGESADNPSSLGQALKKTYAKVDKVNQQIELVAKDVSEHSTAISNLQIDANSIRGSVESVQKNLDNAMEGVDDDIETLTKKVEATMTAEDVQLKISEALSDGVNEVTTTTGFTFNKDGLTVSKTGSEMTTNIDEDGMSIYRDNVEVLTADNTGVKALNLHASTYLIIGDSSRFEDYTNTSGQKRTGCFWIG